MEGLILEYAPLIMVLIAILIQWRLFVSPVELEKKHREIMKDMEDKFVSWAAFKILKETVDNVDNKVSKIYEILVINNKEV